MIQEMNNMTTIHMTLRSVRHFMLQNYTKEPSLLRMCKGFVQR